MRAETGDMMGRFRAFLGVKHDFAKCMAPEAASPWVDCTILLVPFILNQNVKIMSPSILLPYYLLPDQKSR